ncbi:MAG: cytochrome c [Acidobacteria bacterium]|nr:cytochrome c [Acidobacteriota bacterium]
MEASRTTRILMGSSVRACVLDVRARVLDVRARLVTVHARRPTVLARSIFVFACTLVPCAVAAQDESAAAPGSVWDGVFTEAQAARGRLTYAGACGLCHGRRLNGAPDDPDMVSTPPLARARFLREWEGRSLGALLAYTRLTMPEDNPGSLTDAEYVDVIAYMLSVSRMPAGDGELPADARRLADIVIQGEQ